MKYQLFKTTSGLCVESVKEMQNYLGYETNYLKKKNILYC